LKQRLVEVQSDFGQTIIPIVDSYFLDILLLAGRTDFLLKLNVMEPLVSNVLQF